MDLNIAVDVGGTQIRAACYPVDSLEPLTVDRISTQGASGAPLDRLISLIKSIWPEDGQGMVRSIGIAAPGPTNPYKGIVYKAPNIPGWINLPLAPTLQDKFDIPVLLGNDANLAALGEWRYGAGQGHDHLVYMTVSTGIGTGVISDGRLIVGNNGLAPELGHMTVMEGGPVCGCGQTGHVEAVGSGTSIARWTMEEISKGVKTSLPVDREITTREIAQAAREGDQLSILALARAGRYIGHALADIVHAFNPSIIIVGGGVSKSGDLLMEPLRQGIAERVMSPNFLDDLTITNAALGDDSGLLGALALARSYRP